MATQAQIDKFLTAISGFESSGDPEAQNAQASASGLFGFTDGTWGGYGGYAHAREAPAEVQWAKARRYVADLLGSYGGDFRKVAMHWYYPAWVNDPSKWNSVPRPDAGNTKTLAEYANLVMSKFDGSSTRTMTSATSGGTAVATDQPKSRQELLDYIAEHYPSFYGVLNVHPDVKEVLLRAAEEEYSATKLQAELAKTDWWKKTAATARQWDADYALDRATGDAKLKATRDELQAQANRLGVTLSAKELADLALNVNRLGWSQQVIAETLAAKFRQKTAKPGLGTATVDSLRAQMAQYGVNLSDHALTVWTQRILGGNADEAGFTSYLVQQAKKLFPTIADEISEGLTVRDYFDPYAQSAAQVLGINPEEINFAERKWRRALLRLDPQTGKRVPMDPDAWEVELRTNPLYGYDKTANGRHESAQFGAQLARELGYA